jgi:hypothetical protein
LRDKRRSGPTIWPRRSSIEPWTAAPPRDYSKPRAHSTA